MKEIKLTQGKVALVDDADYDWLNKWKWCADKNKYSFYALRRDGKRKMKMHRVILGLRHDDKRMPDHIDKNGLNNQRNNLRIATKAQNNSNKSSSNTKSETKYLGVYWEQRLKRWRASVTKNNIKNHLGCFKTEEEAALAYNEAAIKYHGEFANLNAVGLK